jgi:hypothetical protein
MPPLAGHERSPFGTSDLAHAAGTDSINRADVAQKYRNHIRIRHEGLTIRNFYREAKRSHVL